MVRVVPHLTRKSLALLSTALLILLGVPALLAAPAGATGASVDFSQCANGVAAPHDCTWINGDLQSNNSVYAEGMSTLQRLVLSGVPTTAGDHHSLVFHTSFTKGGLHSYDFLTSWDQAVAASNYYQVPFANLNPCVGVAGSACTTLAATTPTAVAVPDDAFVSHDGATQSRIDQYEALFGDRSVSLYGNAAVSGATLTLSHVDTGGVVPDGADTGDTDIAWTLSWTGATSNVMLTFGAHVAKGVGLTGWGAKTGASTISGAPYHVSLDALDGASLGSQDNQMMGTTVEVPGILTVTKRLSPSSDPGRFDLQVAGTSYATGVGDGGTTGALTFVPGSYDVGEVASSAATSLANYDTSTTCKDNAGTGNVVATGTGHGVVSVTLASEENVVCTITNTRSVGAITVTKSIVGDPVGADRHFSFAVDCPGTADDQTLSLDLSNALSGSVASTPIPIGTACSVAEGAHDGYAMTVSPAGGAVTVPGTVAFTNTRNTDVITVSKALVGAVAGASTVFAFDVTCPSAPAYDQTVTLDAAASSTATTSPIPTRVACSVVEESTAGWQQTTPAQGGIDLTVPGSAAFTNTRLTGALQLAKSVTPSVGSYSVGDPSNTLTYKLSLSPTGALDHTGVSVSDYVPGFDPADPKSGKATYVAGSATCSTGCPATYDASKHLLTWAVGNVAHDAAAVVLSFKVTIDRPSFSATAGLPTETIDNVGYVQSLQQGRTPSNQVKTPVAAVLGVKVVRAPKLAFTGAPAEQLLVLGLLLLGTGIVLLSFRRREQ